MSFELRHLEAFVKVAETGSFSIAAKALLRTQPTLSHTIRELEESLSLRLFDRGGRKVTLTGNGKTFLPLARRLLRLRDEALAVMAPPPGSPQGEIAVGGSTIAGVYLLPPMLKKFRGLYPEVVVSIVVADTRRIEEQVASGELEVGLVGARPRSGRLEATPCFGDCLVVIFPPGHPFSGKKAVTPEELIAEPLLLREAGSGTRATFEQALREAGFPGKLTVAGEVGSTEGIKQGAMAGLGAAVVSAKAVTLEVAQGLLGAAPVAGLALSRSFYLIHPPREHLSPLAGLMARFLSAEGAVGEPTATLNADHRRS